MAKFNLLNTLLWVSRIIFGVVFIFSGFVKAIDPLGFSYKIEEYFLAFDIYWLSIVAIPAAVIISAAEFLLGVTILLGIKMRLSAWVAMLFMLFFTPFTLYVALFNPVTHCGCFGDALVLTNWTTFGKNVVLLAASILIFVFRKRFSQLWPKPVEWVICGSALAFIVGLSVYCLRNLPIIDFLPWRVGNNIAELTVPTPEIADVYLLYRNKQTGEMREYTPSNLPWNDPDWMNSWEFVEQRRVIIQKPKDAPVSNFFILDQLGDDFTEAYIGAPGHQLIVVAYDLYKTNTGAFVNSINYLAQRAYDKNIPLIVLTASPFQSIDTFRQKVQAAYPFYQSDETALKSIIRSNPGLLLMNEGVVLGKWHWRNIPEFETIMARYIQLPKE